MSSLVDRNHKYIKTSMEKLLVDSLSEYLYSSFTCQTLFVPEHYSIYSDGATYGLDIQAVTSEDTGLYLCVASNETASCSCVGQLNIQGQCLTGAVARTRNLDLENPGFNDVCSLSIALVHSAV